LNERFVDALGVFTGGVDEADCGQRLDFARDAVAEIVNAALGIQIEEFGTGAGLGEAMVYIADALVAREGAEPIAHMDAVE